MGTSHTEMAASLQSARQIQIFACTHLCAPLLLAVVIPLLPVLPLPWRQSQHWQQLQLCQHCNNLQRNQRCPLDHNLLLCDETLSKSGSPSSSLSLCTVRHQGDGLHQPPKCVRAG